MDKDKKEATEEKKYAIDYTIYDVLKAAIEGLEADDEDEENKVEKK